MTNRERLISAIETGDFYSVHEAMRDADYCHHQDTCDTLDDCSACRIKWLSENYSKPMPTLKAGMFVKARSKKFNYTNLGVLVEHRGSLAVTYQNEGFDWLGSLDIVAVYTALSFDDCTDNTKIWEEEE